MLSLLFALIDRFLLPARAASRAGWLREVIYAHRGLHGPGVPENSLAAADAAIARGFGIECDVQRSRDGQAIVFHDWTLGRLTGEAGPVAARPAAALTSLALGKGSERIPALRDLLALVAMLYLIRTTYVPAFKDSVLSSLGVGCVVVFVAALVMETSVGSALGPCRAVLAAYFVDAGAWLALFAPRLLREGAFRAIR